jgi:pyruvate formate lyase activating enzyme
MKIGGIQKVSLVDYPGHTCAAIFTIGCNMRCGYCHNPELVLPERYADVIPEDYILQFLQSRIGKLEGVVVSGGEPTMHEDLPDFIRQVKAMGFLVKLDSNGTNPQMLKYLIDNQLIDYVAMDIKGAPENYQTIVAFPIDMDAVLESIRIIKSSGIDHEFRTTVVKSQISFDDFDKIGQLIKGSPRYALQKFNAGKTLSPRFRSEVTYSDDEFDQLKSKMEGYVKLCVVH